MAAIRTTPEPARRAVKFSPCVEVRMFLPRSSAASPKVQHTTSTKPALNASSTQTIPNAMAAQREHPQVPTSCCQPAPAHWQPPFQACTDPYLVAAITPETPVTPYTTMPQWSIPNPTASYVYQHQPVAQVMASPWKAVAPVDQNYQHSGNALSLQRALRPEYEALHERWSYLSSWINNFDDDVLNRTPFLDPSISARRIRPLPKPTGIISFSRSSTPLPINHLCLSES